MTVRICLEYFTVFHPRLVATEDPTLLALFWGVAATWWAGVGGGLLLAAAARAGRRPRVEARVLVRPVGWLLLAMAGTAAAAGLVGNVLAGAKMVVVWPPSLEARIPPAERVDFLTCLWIHNGSYLAGFLGTAALAVITWRRRGRLVGSGA